jgi:pilus assembly protein CpaC
MRPRRAAASKIVALAIYIIVILVATPQAQQPVSFSGSPGAIVAGPAAVAPDATGIDLLVGRSTILNVGSAISRVSLTVPDVADAMVTAPQQLLIHGKAPGVISMFVWDRAGGIKTYEVNVRRDLTQLIEQMRNLFPGEPVSVVGSGKDVVLSGTVSNKYVIDKAAEVAGGYVEKKENVVNLLKQQEGVASNQVLLRVRFAEVSRSALQELGASLFTGPTGYKNLIARATTQQFPAPNFDELSRTSDLDNNLTGASGKYTLSDFLNLFLFSNKYNVGTVIRALQSKGLFQSLAEPNLIALNGKEASFLAGGEYPYPVVQPGSGGAASVSISFKEFGVRLNFTPTVLGGDLINLKVRPEVSSLDFSNAVTLSGFRVPALSTRRTETEVELQDGQTFAIAGLMNNTVNSSMQKVPGIGDIPILGYLFRSRAYQKNQTELVVMITPQIVRRGSMGASQGLPTAVEPYLGAPDKSVPQPAPFIGSPRYPGAGGPSSTTSQPRTGDNNGAAAPSPAPAQMNEPAAAQKAMPEQKPAAQQKATAAQPPAKAASKPADKALEQQRENDRHQAEAAAKAKAEQDRKDAEAKKIADQKAADEKVRQQKLDEERAKREAEVARKNAEVERQRQAEAKKREKSLSEAAERLRQAQAAYQAEIDKAKGGKGGESKH